MTKISASYAGSSVMSFTFPVSSCCVDRSTGYIYDRIAIHASADSSTDIITCGSDIAAGNSDIRVIVSRAFVI